MRITFVRCNCGKLHTMGTGKCPQCGTELWSLVMRPSIPVTPPVKRPSIPVKPHVKRPTIQLKGKAETP